MGDNIKPYIIAGPEIGFLVTGKNNVKATSEAEAMGTKVGPYTVEQEADIKESLESLELAINLGAGLIVPLGTLDVFVDAQYSLGLTNIGKDIFSFGEDIRNQVIVINIGMIFGGK